MGNNKKIIGIIGIIFVALVGYKFISSNIQENKEKAVLQEKYYLEQSSKKTLQDCIDNAKTEIQSIKDSYEIFDATSCTKQEYSKEWCRAEFYRQGEMKENKAIEQCFRLYK